MKQLLKELFQIIVFPIFVLFSSIQALVAKPFHFNYSKGRGLEIGIVPLAVIIGCWEFLKFIF